MSLRDLQENYLSYPKGFVSRVSTKYTRPLIISGVIQIVASVVSLVIGLFALTIYLLNIDDYLPSDFLVISPALWCWPWFMASGILSIQSAKPGRNKKITASLVMSTFSILFACFLISLGVVSTLHSLHDETTRDPLLTAMHSFLTMFGAIELGSATAQTVFCSKKTCCLPRNIVSPTPNSYPQPVGFQTVQIPVYDPKKKKITPWDS